jgi:hypothetical protein
VKWPGTQPANFFTLAFWSEEICTYAGILGSQANSRRAKSRRTLDRRKNYYRVIVGFCVGRRLTLIILYPDFA